MSDTTTELEVLDQIVDVLGGQSGQYETVVPVLRQIKELLAGGGGGGGYNPALSVGRADALTGADSTAQWMQRVTEGSGSATVRSVQGAAVTWNQLVFNGNFESDTNWIGRESTISVADGVATITPISDGVQRGIMQAASLQTTIIGHKYLISVDFKCNELTNLQLSCSGGTPATATVTSVNAWSHCAAIWTAQVAVTSRLYILSSDTVTTAARLQFKNAMLIDLTQMFGAGNEPSTVAEFERMYPEPYYPYSAPTLKPVRISGIRSTDAQGGELDSVEWEAQTLRAASSVRDELTASEVVRKVGEVTLGANNCTVAFTDAGTNQTRVQVNVTDWDGKGGTNVTSDQFVTGPADWSHITLGTCRATTGGLFLGLPATVTNNTQAKAWIVEHAPKFYYELATPTTTPISPALPMTYRVQQGGSEAIIVPSGEISAAPIITVAEGESVADVVMDALACIATPDGPVATANHAINTYLTMGGKLYKVTTAIAAGETIVAGTNVTETTVMAELIALTQ